MADRKSTDAREQKVRETLARMTLDEKIREMSATTPLWKHAIMVPRYNQWTYDAGGCRRLGVPKLRFTDGPRGVTIGHSTCFPVSMARGATWDAALEERVGEAIGYEARARGANFFGGVCINLLRHPGWGRAQETYGEDPHHLGVMGVALLTGAQKHVMACAKHYACNSIERSRFYVDVKVKDRALREVYLPHFKKCVDAGVAAVMSAYNQVNGSYCGHHRTLLTDILKKEWGFDGFVISDFLWGVRETEAAANAGLDIEMPIVRFYGKKLKKAVEAGRVPLEQIDDAALRVLRQKDRFQDVGLKTYDPKKVAGKDHAALALEVARKSMVLLRNEKGALPLRRGEVKTVAVIGKLAARANLGDFGSSRVRPPYAVTPLEGVRELAGPAVKVTYASGDKLEEALAAARDADATVVVVGLTGASEGEYIPIPGLNWGGDRGDLRLPEKSEQLILEVAAVSKRCIVALEAGSALITEAWREKVAAIVMAWYPGMEGGRALAEVLFGDVNPSGKLPLVFPKSPAQLPAFDMLAKEAEYGLYHGYRLLDKKEGTPAFAFGFGLSYTERRYENLRLKREDLAPDGTLEVEVDVTNIGAVAGEEVVQLYVGYTASRIERPRKELKAFTRVALAAGEKKTVALAVPVRELAYYRPERQSWEVEEVEHQVMVGPSSRDEDLTLAGTFRVVKEA